MVARLAAGIVAAAVAGLALAGCSSSEQASTEPQVTTYAAPSVSVPASAPAASAPAAPASASPTPTPTPSPVPTSGAAPAPVAKVSATNASEEEIFRALSRVGVVDPDRWTQKVIEYRPYPANDPNLGKLRQNLVRDNPGQATIDKIVSALAP